MSIKNFLAYHNAVPIALGIAFLGAGGVFAATNPEAIYSAQQKVISIDNTYIANKDLASYTPRAQILGVTEDSDNYFVSYKFYTIDLKDYVWQEVAKDEEMKVSKPDLGPYRDLGLYVTEQLKQIVDREGMRLAETQEIERKYVTRKVVATAYGGLVGKFLDSTTEELPGYTPVVTPPEPPPVVVAVQTEPTTSSVSVESQSQTAATANGSTATTQQVSQAPVAASSADTIPPVIQVLGENPARVLVGASYNDLGAVATDNINTNINVRVFVNGVAQNSVTIDTSKAGEWTIRYEATDSSGNLGFAERKISVVEPAPQTEIASTTPEQSSAPAATTTDSSAPVSSTAPQAQTAAAAAPTEPTPTPTPAPEPAMTPTPEPAPSPAPTPEPDSASAN